ncbi:MAG: fatty acid desaturase [Pseudomonadota bacterium]
MDHRTFLASIDDDERLRLTQTSDLAGLSHLAGHLSLILILGALVLAKVPGWWVLILPLGIATIFLFTLLHETCHFTPFRSRWLNIWVGTLCGLIVILPPLWFRYFHLAHHRHTHDPEKDPELAEPKPETWAAWVLHVSGLPVWRSHVSTLLRNAAGRCDDTFVPAARRGAVRLEARAMLGLYTAILVTSLLTGSAALIWVWVLPVLVGQPFLRLYLLAEHGRCPHVADMFLNTRTTFTSRAIRFIAWNMPYHAEHHTWPTVPFHRLPELHVMVRKHLKSTSDGYAAFTREYLGDLKG